MSKTYTDKWIDKSGNVRYFQDAEATLKLVGIEEGAQENTIESISVNNLAVNPDANKNVNITIPSAPVQSVSKNNIAINPDANGNVNIAVPTGSAANKEVDNSISAASESVNLPTSAAVASFVEGKGYSTFDGAYSSLSGKPTLGTAAALDSTTSIGNGGTGLPTSGTVYNALQNIVATTTTDPGEGAPMTSQILIVYSE